MCSRLKFMSYHKAIVVITGSLNPKSYRIVNHLSSLHINSRRNTRPKKRFARTESVSSSYFVSIPNIVVSTVVLNISYFPQVMQVGL